MQKQQNLQDVILNQARRDKVPVTLFLVNGFQLRGNVRGFDNFTVIVESDEKQQMIYKHAISTLVLGRQIDLQIEVQPEPDC